ncbi:hypothetical protein L3X38_016868 [Prunus dulcis]|uniref:Reverse transcriptase Ty1/copia-type domain-containing protein n=1 Tax=Prunus dulcis TaxID=3755 RepID=A0AAD4Z8M4_PRUDU|nr:hypothetical protein L3X38_016868 [Prunus dulcis]
MLYFANEHSFLSPLLLIKMQSTANGYSRSNDALMDQLKHVLSPKGHQQSGINYFHSFSPVVKSTTIRTILSIAVSCGCGIWQLDVKNAFIHCYLSEAVFMQQPSGFANPLRPTHVCKLHKTIYGLKQAPRAWFKRFSAFQLQVGFIESRFDSSLFMYRDCLHVMILLLYVDDIVLTGSNPSQLFAFIHALSIEFKVKDLGRLYYFLGIEVSHLKDSIHLTQNKYTLDLLWKSNLLECKPVSTPLASQTSASCTDGSPLTDPTLYPQLVSGLQYLTITHPDIAYAVQHVSQFMSSPSDTHLEAVKHILHYLKGTLGHGLSLCHSNDSSLLIAYSDGQGVQTLVDQLQGSVSFWDPISFHGVPRNNVQCLDLASKPNTVL